MLAGVLLLAGAVGGGSIPRSLAAAEGVLPAPFLLVVALLLFVGAAAKSAQVPLQGWLPDAMLGPTPVSALIHSATMVAAGVFLVARFYPLFLAAGPALAVVAWVGVATALLGSLAALVEPDAKRTLAYSTMSQLGLMFVGLGAGSLVAGLLLLVAHALYKSLLFLTVGGVEHEVEGSEFERMGGLAYRMPGSFAASAVAAAALAGLPFTLALPPKDPALAAAWETAYSLFAVALLASLATALYSARILGLVFLGPPAPAARGAREAPPGLLLPTLTLALLLLLGGLANAAFLGYPLASLLGGEAPRVPVVTALALSVAVVGAGVGLWARRVWPEAVVWPSLRRLAPAAGSEFGLVHAYRVATRAGLMLVGWAGLFDRGVFDRAANWLAVKALRAVRWVGWFDLRRLDGAVCGFANGLLYLGQRVRVLQTGRIENYLLVIFLWGLAALVAGVVGSAMVGR